MSLPVATALRRTLRQGYGGSRLRADVLAGLVVGIVAVPLSMALAIAVGAPPQSGLFTAAIAGAIAALAGGSKVQVTGPTAAFVVVLAPITTRFGLGGLLMCGLMAGVLLVAMGLARLGRLIEYIPHPVTTGFTAGIGVVIALLQLKDVFGLQTGTLPAGALERVAVFYEARHTASGVELGVAGCTLTLLLLWPRVSARVPSPLVALVAVSVGAYVLKRMGVHVETIGTRFSSVVDGVSYAGIPPRAPDFALPWRGMQLGQLRELFPYALSVALLGAIESLLSAVVADGMTGRKHDPDAELIGQGLANLAVPFFGGIAATGALARTATNVRAGATSPVAALVHATFVFASLLLLAPLVAHVPMAALAGLLLVVAARMSEARHFVHIVRVAPRSDVVVLLTCFALTIVMDMVVAITTGIVLAALLFMRRMSAMTAARLSSATEPSDRSVPAGVLLYEIDGPLFFGAAARAMSALGSVHDQTRVVVLSLARVGVIDATGFVALESAIALLQAREKLVILAGPLPEPRATFTRARLEKRFDNLLIADGEAEAMAIAADLSALNPDWSDRVNPPLD